MGATATQRALSNAAPLTPGAKTAYGSQTDPRGYPWRMEVSVPWFTATQPRLLVLHEEDESDDDVDLPLAADDYPETFKELAAWLVQWFKWRVGRR